MNRISESIIFGTYHHVDLFRRNAFKIWNGLDFRKPIIFCIVLRNIETIYFVFGRTFLSKDSFLGAVDNEVSAGIKTAFPGLRMIYVFVLMSRYKLVLLRRFCYLRALLSILLIQDWRPLFCHVQVLAINMGSYWVIWWV